MNERLKELRKALGYKNQQDFADALNIKRGTIANYEIGRNEPIDAVVTLICSKFNVNKDWLKYGKGEMFNELDMEDELMKWAGKLLGSTDSFKKNLVRVLMSLNETEWEFLEQKAKELANYDKKKD